MPAYGRIAQTLQATNRPQSLFQAAAQTDADELRSSLEATNDLLTKAMKTASEQAAAAAEALADKQKELDSVQVKVVTTSHTHLPALVFHLHAWTVKLP